MKKGSKAYSIFKHKCARCQEADLFVDPHTYNLGNLFKMHERCPHCDQKHEIEIGFWWGAMYIAYAISSFELLFCFAILFFVFDLEVMTALYSTFAIGFLLAPYVFRTSRAIWLNFFVHYDKTKSWEKGRVEELLSEPDPKEVAKDSDSLSL